MMNSWMNTVGRLNSGRNRIPLDVADMLRLQDVKTEDWWGLPGVAGRHSDTAGDDQPGGVQAPETAGEEAEGETEVSPPGGGRPDDPPLGRTWGGTQGKTGHR